MTIHKCDICRKEIGVWLEVKIDIGSIRQEINVGDLLYLRGTKEICKDCFLGRAAIVDGMCP